MIANNDQIADEVKALFSRWLEGKGTEADRAFVMAELRKRGVPIHTYDFSNILVEGISRADACDRLLELTFRKAFDLLRTEFGSVARFQPRPMETFDFYWRKAKLVVKITGPLMAAVSFGSPGGDFLKRESKEPTLPLLKSFGMASGYMGIEIEEVHVPYYGVWHTPQKLLAEIRARLVASGAYPRLSPNPSA